MAEDAKADIKTETTPAVGAAAETAAAAPAAAETVAKPEASPLAAADAAKREGAAKDDAAKAEAKPETKPETKPDAKAEAKPKPETKESGAESVETKPPETKAEAKPEGEKKPDGEAKPEDTKADTKEAPADKPQAPPVYEALKLADGVKLDDQRVKAFDELIGKTELSTKADHAAMQSLRQDLANMYVDEVQRIGKQVEQHQRDVWNRLIEQRVNELKADPQLGGNRIETTLGNAKYALESMIPGFSKDEAKELIAVMDAGGVSHHKLMIKALNGIYELLREPEPVPGQLPLSASTPKEPGKRGWYDSTDVKAAS
jgi:hypothetical protein